MTSFCRDSEPLQRIATCRRSFTYLIHLTSQQPTSREWKRSRLSHLECFSIITRENFIAWRAEQNYHRGPKRSLALVNNYSKYDHFKKAGYHPVRICTSRKNKELLNPRTGAEGLRGGDIQSENTTCTEENFVPFT